MCCSTSSILAKRMRWNLSRYDSENRNTFPSACPICGSPHGKKITSSCLAYCIFRKKKIGGRKTRGHLWDRICLWTPSATIYNSGDKPENNLKATDVIATFNNMLLFCPPSSRPRSGFSLLTSLWMALSNFLGEELCGVLVSRVMAPQRYHILPEILWPANFSQKSWNKFGSDFEQSLWRSLYLEWLQVELWMASGPEAWKICLASCIKH